MSTLALAFAAAQALAVQLVAAPALALGFEKPPALAVQLVSSVPTIHLVVRAPTALDAALLPILIGPPGPPGTGDGSSAPTSPTFTYTGGWLTAVVYADGTTKALSYTDGQLAQVDTLRPGLPTVRKTLSYNPDGTLASVLQTVI